MTSQKVELSYKSREKADLSYYGSALYCMAGRQGFQAVDFDYNGKTYRVTSDRGPDAIREIELSPSERLERDSMSSDLVITNIRLHTRRE